MPAKPLTPEQIEDAGRLRQLFGNYQNKLKDAGEPWAQEVMAERLGFGQSALSQYLKGAIPLNPRTIRAFSSLMGCDPAMISPRIAMEQRSDAEWWLPAGGLDWRRVAYQMLEEVPAGKAAELIGGFIAAVESRYAEQEASLRAKSTPSKV